MVTPADLITRAAVFMTAVAILATPTGTVRAQATDFDSPLVGVSLIADVESIAPGQPFQLGVRFDIEPTWHINWKNPGDAGLAPSVAWRLPDGFRAAALEWPHPERYDAGPLSIFGYESRVTLWTTVTPPNDLQPGQRVTLAADVDWLACQEACVPGESSTRLDLPVEPDARADAEGSRDYLESHARIPVEAEQWVLAAAIRGDEIDIQLDPVQPLAGPSPADVRFYPDVPGIIENAAAQRLETAGAGMRLVVPRARMGTDPPPRLTGVLVSPTGWGIQTGPALRIDVPLQPR